MTQKFTAVEVRKEADFLSTYSRKTSRMLAAYADTLSKPADSGRVMDEVDKIITGSERMGYAVDTSISLHTLREVRAALAAQGQGDSEPAAWRIGTDDDVERVAKAAGWDNRRYMTPADYAIWCVRMREFVRLAVTRPAPPASPAGVPDGWLPIESAPNDGTPHVRGLHVFSSTDGAHLYWDAVVGRIDTEDGQFYDLGGDLSSGWAADDFTHWHALAAAPSAPEGDGGEE